MARSERGKPGERPSGKRGGPVKLLFAGILLGLAAAAVMAWYLLPRDSDFRKVESAPEMRIPPTSVATPPPAPPQPTQTTPAPPAAPPPDPSNYTFYDILPGNKAPKPAPAPAKEQWWLQVAALKSAQDADTLRARLTLLNLATVVQAIPGGTPLHRVRVGPFESREAAESTRETLTVNNFEARLLKEPVTP